MIDTHCHVHFQAYQQDMDQVIERSLAEGVFMITVGTQSSTSQNGLAVAHKYQGLWASIGLHPNHTCEQEFVDVDELPEQAKVHTRCESFNIDFYRKLAADPKCVAIGECGLDFYRIPETADRQEVIAKQYQAVRAQFDLAAEMNLPVIIHCREAHQEQIELIREYIKAGKLARRGVVHCFTGTLVEAKSYIDLGFLLSFTGIITFPPRKGEGVISPLQKVVQELPLEKMMVETDAPYLSPVPRRGERNEPVFVRHILEKVAELRGVAFSEAEQVTDENARRLFKINF